MALIILVLALYLATAVLGTYPLVTHIDEKVPFDLGDPLFMGWLVSWNDAFFLSQQLSLAKLFNANIYYPYENTLAYSDLMLVPSLMVLPVYYLTGNPLITVNVLLIVLLAGSATAMFLLARYLTQNIAAALLAGFFYTFSTYHLAQIGHIQLHADMFLILMLLFMHLWLDRRKPAYLSLAVLMILLETLSSLYYAIYAAMLFALFVGFFLIWGRLKLDKRNLASLAAAVVLAGLVAFPFLRPYMQLYSSMPNFERSLSEAAYYAAGPADYLASVPQNLLWGRWLGLSKSGVEDVLFPGLAVIVLAVVGAAGMARSSGLRERVGEVKLFYSIVAWTAFVLSLGPYKIIHGRIIPLPFLFPFELVPGFKSMRVPSRFGLLVLLGLCVLAAYGVDRLMRLRRERGLIGGRAKFLTAAALAMIVFQQVSWPIPLSPPIASGGRIPAIYKWLATYKGADVVIELPPIQTEQVKYVYYSAYHSKRLVNGYSGYTPPLWTGLAAELTDFPSASSVVKLRALGVDGVLIHGDLMPQTKTTLASAKHAGLRLIKQIDNDYFFEIAAGQRI